MCIYAHKTPFDIIPATCMKYEYAYKTPDGIRHVKEIESPSREAAFEALRKQGIKAIKVVAKDGSKANGEVRVVGIKKRFAFVAIVIAALLAACLTWFMGDVGDAHENETTVITNTIPVAISASDAISSGRRIAAPLPRQTIQGDRRRIENAPTNLFSTAAEMYLSKFAEPGRDFGGIVSTGLYTNKLQLLEMLNAPIYTADNEFTEYVDLKRITASIKREMRNYILAGRTQQEYLSELVKRQRLEMGYRQKAEKKLQLMVADKNSSKANLYDFWLKANAQLQSMGIYPLPLPDSLRDYETPFDIDE